MAKIADEVRLVISQILEKQIAAEAQKQVLTIEEFARIQIQAGVPPATVRNQIIEQLQIPDSRIWSGFRAGLKNAVYGAENIAASKGMEIALEESGGLEKLWRWQTNGTNICEDCEERHGEVGTLEYWRAVGMPKQFASRCLTNCQCTLMEVVDELEPIRIGQE